jgi:hypothetical protein
VETEDYEAETLNRFAALENFDGDDDDDDDDEEAGDYLNNLRRKISGISGK